MGEIRDRETMEHAVAFAETGHFAWPRCIEQRNRRLTGSSTSSSGRRARLLMDSSLNLKSADVAAPLAAPGGQGRVAAVEMMLNTPLISDLILKGEVAEIKGDHGEAPARARHADLRPEPVRPVREPDVTYEDAFRNADSVNDLRLQIKLHSHRARAAAIQRPAPST
jgi:twitching motility protein PilU